MTSQAREKEKEEEGDRRSREEDLRMEILLIEVSSQSVVCCL